MSEAGWLIRPVGPGDVPALLEMFRELAVYEKLEHVLVADEELLSRALFGERPAAEALIAEQAGEPAGYAVFFATFSTFLARQGVWLEDVFVRPHRRRGGVGRGLVAAVASLAAERGAERLEWSALRWNELALDFYRGLGAERMDDWVTLRLAGEELRRLAAESPSAGAGAG
jgi:GNAT superfamily N-acetyltransferase